MEEEYSTRELEWFDIETKMRELMQQQLEPVLSKAREDRETNARLKNIVVQLEDRIKELELSVLGDQPFETVIDSIKNKHTELEGNRKKDAIIVNQEFSGIKEIIKSFQFQLGGFQEMLNNFDELSKSTRNEINQMRMGIDANQQLVMNEFNGVNARFQEMTKAYIDYNLRAEEKANRSLIKSSENSIEIASLRKDVNSLRAETGGLLSSMEDQNYNKLSIATFNIEKALIEQRFESCKEKLDKFNDELIKRDSFIDKYIPLKIATIVSDYMHSSLDLLARKRIAEFEMNFLRDLNSEALIERGVEPREIQVTKILEDMRHIEQRKVDLLSDKKSKRQNSAMSSQRALSNPSDPESPINMQNVKAPLPQIEEVEVNPANQIYNIENIQEIVEKVFEEQFEPHILKFRFEIKDKFAMMQKIIKTGDDQCMALANHLIEEIEDLNKKVKKDRADFEANTAESREKHNKIDENLEKIENSLSNTAQMVVCLVECAQIQQALEAQDEEDRHSMAQNYERDLQNELVMSKPKYSPEPYSSTVPSANFSLQKKCLGCGNTTSIISGYRTSIMYKPTPLFYRNKKLDRPELISLKGNIIKRCWESVSPAMPWKQNDFEQIILDASKNWNKRNISNESTLSEPLGREALPMLVSPANRSFSNSRRSKLTSYR
ncbi:unnamed protein product [Blepharisma stoltei]|uniref:Uncharacterized protein n=1 Tax=Blepharisma stoltei TaxID=1481888 RepID=A0AAU9J9K3_9CILI|nr:unnamed protein product [Blepharisma stoltei]